MLTTVTYDVPLPQVCLSIHVDAPNNGQVPVHGPWTYGNHCGATFTLTGCSGPATGPTSPYYQFTAIVSINGVQNAWKNASLYGQAIPSTYSCDPSTDTNCVVDIGSGQTTNQNGIYNLVSDAIPGTWTIGATADSTCSTGASLGGIQLGASGASDIVCGNVGTGTLAISPSSCVTYYYSNKPSTTNCPSTIACL